MGLYQRVARRDRHGLSIIELMIAIAISLVVLVVMMQAFRRASTEIKKGRAMIEMASEMRGVGETFRRDTAYLTVTPRVWSMNSESNGYLEIIEGVQNDGTYHATYPGMSFFGDVDDVIAMTVRSGDKPFRGRWVDTLGNTRILESYVAEVIWFVFNDNRDDANANVVDMDDQAVLYRRVLLVHPFDPANPTQPIPLTGATIDDYFRDNDISAHEDSSGGIVANTLSDLTARENRYAHDRTAYPYLLDPVALANRRIPTGEDIVLTNVAGFDIRVYSPNAPMETPNDTQFMDPNDPNYAVNLTPTSDEGAYVDLGWNGNTDAGWFSQIPAAPFDTAPTWDSWSPHYFYGSAATNGLDDDGDGLVDEENENSNYTAPYPYPVRGLELTMRGIEKSTRNIRQVTITSNFVPE